ncbi:hypothetical protein L9F63_000851, partial [Diploptera punctata]
RILMSDIFLSERYELYNGMLLSNKCLALISVRGIFLHVFTQPFVKLKLFAFKEKVTNREKCYRLVPRDYPVTITKQDKYSDCSILEGHFLSPFVTHLPGIVPKEAEMAHFQVVLPRKWNSDHYKPICLHLAGTGDHGFWRRRQMMAKPLLKEGGIGSLILENPFYGLRKPKDQVRSSLHNVSDIIVMGGCLILESLVLFHWCESNGFGPLGVTGMSMGGHMASLAATNWPKPIVLVPCLSWSTATPVFTQGVMSHSINWELLGSQYFADDVFREEIRKYIRVDKDAFRAGQHFAKHYPYSMDRIRRLTAASSDAHKNQILQPSRQPESKDSNELQDGSLKQLKDNIKEKMSRWREDEALLFMQGIMDECTHLRNFTVPVDTSLIIAICAKDDAYVPREGFSDLVDIWPGAEVRFLDAGHVSAYLLHKHTFRAAIVESFQLYEIDTNGSLKVD